MKKLFFVMICVLAFSSVLFCQQANVLQASASQTNTSLANAAQINAPQANAPQATAGQTNIQNDMYVWQDIPGEEDNPKTRLSGRERSPVFGNTPSGAASGTTGGNWQAPPNISWSIQGPGTAMTVPTSSVSVQQQQANMAAPKLASAGNTSLPPNTPRQPGVYIAANTAVRAADTTRQVPDPNDPTKTITETVKTTVSASGGSRYFVWDVTAPLIDMNISQDKGPQKNADGTLDQKNRKKKSYIVQMQENPVNRTRSNKSAEIKVTR